MPLSIRQSFGLTMFCFHIILNFLGPLSKCLCWKIYRGKIISFSLMKDGVKDGLSLVPKKNQSNRVVEMPSIKGEKIRTEEDFKRLIEEIKQFKVDTINKTGKLIRK
jgi:hypothetical protein